VPQCPIAGDANGWHNLRPESYNLLPSEWQNNFPLLNVMTENLLQGLYSVDAGPAIWAPDSVVQRRWFYFTSCHPHHLRRQCSRRVDSCWSRSLCGRWRVDAREAPGDLIVRMIASTAGTGTAVRRCVCGSDASVHQNERTANHNRTIDNHTASRLHTHTCRPNTTPRGYMYRAKHFFIMLGLGLRALRDENFI